ncbi:hypothetical protein [Pseudoalteromonas denitrificans]|uniref:Uncharacterized protein n=1 Tax=Pseudoalteromonas denitrificans DSM 6059 TaxID=1123010 RepID=A0A1I1GKD0_9GAMM|nr:hypothetical protein [Pseudoalteromonas denitrificans]SFC11732.1 hypothetical protein SAMN02745724_00921 [Pseudoalteromonas denitrificans DSM 6059]
MSRKSIRKIHIAKQEYVWVTQQSDLTLYPFVESYVRVNIDRNNSSILYIDISSWHFELKPSEIKLGIEFALEYGWKPEGKENNILLKK